MKARVIATGNIVDIIRNSAFDKDVFYDSNGQNYNREELSFDFKEKSFPKDDDYWTRLEHQYAGMAMQGILANIDLLMSLAKKKADDYPAKYTVAEFAKDCAHALVKKMKEEEKLRMDEESDDYF